MDIKRLHVGKRLSEATIHNNTIYLAGQVAETTDADITGQAREVLASIDRLLAEAGSDKSKLLFTQIYITDLANFAAFNEVWEAWVVPGSTPARATVEAKLANPGWLVEVVATAAL
ncbi:enamine deaminase RidA (YjgF/YER057c/UK114 family) [Pseudoduganella lurida]|uniref:Enamine deaminase RidA (YjgF/YER057c/UK114 family) n=1 Tax=Pseudoduganella lurida TaxID=1036180 RepID=A0A562RGR8_9BURK|nr:RidA family protein [Pseudoduganella lurida]TWI67566.1 enamine deaminase RidA (YjgF/YER057c/UK114 family) [Pseudoduganella lurida]